jgi:hypothetical protein
MQYVDCPRCRARFHAGAVYESPDFCPRCGAALDSPRPSRGEQLRGLLGRRALSEAPDWEAIPVHAASGGSGRP